MALGEPVPKDFTLERFEGTEQEMHRMVTDAIGKIILDTRFQFLSPIIVSLEVRLNTGVTEIAATDGVSLFIENGFFSYPPEQRISILVHEALHVFLMHTLRGKDRIPEVWNIAGDYVVNDNVVNTFNLPLPNGGLYNPEFLYWSAEQVYALIMSTMPPERRKQLGEGQPPITEGGINIPPGAGQNKSEQQPTGTGNPTGGSGKTEKPAGNGGKVPIFKPDDVMPTPPGQEGEVIDRIHKGFTGGYGSIPDTFREYMSGLLQPKVPWEEVLREFMLEKVKEDYRFGPFRRGHISREIYLPTLDTEEAHMVIAIDTSGSISGEQLQMFLSETDSIASNGHISGIVVLATDIPYWQFEFPPMPSVGEIKSHLQTGGTAFGPTFEGVEKKFPGVINGLVYFTDGEPNESADGWGKEPDFPVLWALTNGDIEVPYGFKLVLPNPHP